MNDFDEVTFERDWWYWFHEAWNGDFVCRVSKTLNGTVWVFHGGTSSDWGTLSRTWTCLGPVAPPEVR